ncbi:MAG TPA: hypothetical protein VFQ41_21160 [Candidatus Angelobacter sp.]|nr:hypothetical protein [Candidatus Angelobacter sp.]
MRNLSKIFFILLASTLVHAHVGSADVYYEGDAGPYHLFVTIRLPQVIPGVAEIQVRSASPEVQNIQVASLRLSGLGSNLPPVPDVAQRSKDDPQFFVGNLWFMEFGALQVRIEADGAKGKAELSVPVASFARQSLPMGRWLGALLGFFFVFLTLSVVLITGAVVRESTVPPGEAPQGPNRRRSRIVMALAMVVVLIIVYRQRTTWSVEAATYERNVDLLKPPRAETTLLDGNRLMVRPAGPLMVPLVGQSQSASAVKMDELIPDHGHVMHLFLIRLPGMEKMWHLHPDLVDGSAFVQRLPAMPAGQYQVFADIVDKSGFPWTLVGKADLPQINGASTIGDDSAWVGARLPAPISETTVADLPDGARVVWERDADTLKANVPTSFKFRVEEKDGSPARGLEPYMGMAAHAQVVCSDLSVFAHIHPAGSISMASLDMAQARLMGQDSTGGSGMVMGNAHSSASLPPKFSFPYGFPHAGDYRVFVQIKRSGQVQTAVFDAHVQ